MRTSRCKTATRSANQPPDEWHTGRMSQDPGVPDLLDDAGRLRRLALAFVIAVLAGGIAYFVCDRLATPDEASAYGGQKVRAYEFVYYVTGLVFAVAFTAALAILKALAKRAERASALPPAKLR